jgi:hypothetical protein
MKESESAPIGVLSRNLCGRIEENQEKPVIIADITAEIRTETPANTCQKYYHSSEPARSRHIVL